MILLKYLLLMSLAEDKLFRRKRRRRLSFACKDQNSKVDKKYFLFEYSVLIGSQYIYISFCCVSLPFSFPFLPTLIPSGLHFTVTWTHKWQKRGGTRQNCLPDRVKKKKRNRTKVTGRTSLQISYALYSIAWLLGTYTLDSEKVCKALKWTPLSSFLILVKLWLTSLDFGLAFGLTTLLVLVYMCLSLYVCMCVCVCVCVI